MTRPLLDPSYRRGWTKVLLKTGIAYVETDKLVAQIRKFRGKKTYAEIVVELGWPKGRYSWLKARDICKRFQISTSDQTDPEYYPMVVRQDMKKLREEDSRLQRNTMLKRTKLKAIREAKSALQLEIQAALVESQHAPRYKPGALVW
jgi:hypothetical protein